MVKVAQSRVRGSFSLLSEYSTAAMAHLASSREAAFYT